MESSSTISEYGIAEVLAAIENHEIQVYFQPQYNALTNRLKGAEALARWVKPDGTVITPGWFVPVLEKTNHILTLDWYILTEVCAFLQCQKKQHIRLVPVSVNFSRKHVSESDFINRLCAIVDKYEIDRNQIIVEITESAFVEQTEKIEDMIKQIRSRGFRVAIDDFGNGLSSLSFVKDIPVDILKIDKSLLSRNCEDEAERILLESIFTFAHRLKMTTVAEGVETREQLGFLRTCDCKMIQGFLFAKPMPAEEFKDLCANNPEAEETEDILMIQAESSAIQLLLEAVFIRYPLVIFSNLSRNSFYMMAYENFSSRSCPSSGVFEELIEHGATTMHPEDRDLFRDTFSIENQMKAYHEGEKFVRVVTRQMGDDGVYHKVETTNYFVKNPSSKDVLVISLCHNLDE